MDRRRSVTAGLFAALLVLAMMSHTATAVDPKCEAARGTLPSNPDIIAFKACAGKKPITAACCRKLLPFAQYYDCLNDPSYVAEVNKFLGSVSSVDEVQKSCLA